MVSSIFLFLIGTAQASGSQGQNQDLTPRDRSNRLETLARRTFKSLTRADLSTVEAVARGKAVCFGTLGCDQETSESSDVKAKPIVNSDVIIWLATDSTAAKYLGAEGIDIDGAHIRGKLNLSYAKLDKALRIRNCDLPDGVVLESAQLQLLDLSGSHIGVVHANAAVVMPHTGPLPAKRVEDTYSIEANGISVTQDVNLDAGFYASGTVDFTGASIGGDFTAEAGTFIATPGSAAIILNEAEVKGGVFLRGSGRRGFHSYGEVDLTGARITKMFECADAEFVNPDREALALDDSRVEGKVFLGSGFVARGEVGMLGAEIGSMLALGTFENIAGKALNMSNARAKEYVYLRQTFQAEGEVNLVSAQIGTDLDLSGGKFVNPSGRSIDAHGVSVGGRLLLRPWNPDSSIRVFFSDGEINLVGAHVNGILDAGGAQLWGTAKSMMAIRASGIQVDRSVFINGGYLASGAPDPRVPYLVAHGEVSFEGSVISGSFNARGAALLSTGSTRDCAILTPDKCDSLNARRVAIGANLVLGQSHRDYNKPFSSKGTVDLVQARIGGTVTCEDGSFEAVDTKSIDASQAEIQGDADLRGLSTNGLIDLHLARIGGDLDLRDAAFADRLSIVGALEDGPNEEVSDDCNKHTVRDGLDAPFAQIGGAFHWHAVTLSKCTELDLRNGHVGVLRDRTKSWPREGMLFVDGFSYQSIGEGPANIRDRKGWLYSPWAQYHPQPYEQLAKVLKESGRENEATEVMIAMEDARRSNAAYLVLQDALHGIGYTPSEIWTPPSEEKPQRQMLVSGEPNTLSHFPFDLVRWLLAFPAKWTIEYGYEPLLASIWLLAFICLGAMVFGKGDKAHLMVPSEQEAYDHFHRPCTRYQTPPYYTQFHVWIYSIETLLPGVKLGQGEFWHPADATGVDVAPEIRGALNETRKHWILSTIGSLLFYFVFGLAPLLFLFAMIFVTWLLSHDRSLPHGTFLRLYLWVHITMGWVLAALFVVGLTGLVHSR